jgi:hypothetical protein
VTRSGARRKSIRSVTCWGPHKYNAYSVNNLTATPNKDSSFTIHFGGDPASVNFLPITEGWN